MGGRNAWWFGGRLMVESRGLPNAELALAIIREASNWSLMAKQWDLKLELAFVNRKLESFLLMEHLN